MNYALPWRLIAVQNAPKFSSAVSVLAATAHYHIPVLLNECCESLSIKDGGVYVDCTLGGGGHTKSILERGGRVIGLDQDPDAIAHTGQKLSAFVQSGQLDIIQSNFRNIKDAVHKSKFVIANGGKVDGVLMDLGISSHQIDKSSRGFAFAADGPLDMRMDKGQMDGNGLTAATILNEWTLEDIANTLFDYGDETRSRQIAREIVLARPLNSTSDFERVIARITSFKQRPQTLARCFQAIRIVVNDEINALEEALENMEDVVRPGGRLVIMSYHSLEDRRVKNLLKFGNVRGIPDSERLQAWKPLSKRALTPTFEEIAVNRRSRSAKLRVAERIDETAVVDNVVKSKSYLGAKQLAKAAKLEAQSLPDSE